MPRNTTEGELPANQEKALAALLAGHTATDAASIAGVHRSTVHRWLKEPEFLAEHNRQKGEIRDAVTGRINALQLTAIEAVESAIGQGDARIALAVLKGTGVLDGNRLSVGPTDPERIIKNERAREREQEMLDDLLAYR